MKNMQISIATLGLALLCGSMASAQNSQNSPNSTITQPGGDGAAVQAPAKETPEQEFTRRKTEAGKDAKKLFDVYLWCKQKDQDKNATNVLREIIKIDPNHENARKLLGYVKHGDAWVTEKELEKIKLEEERAEKEAAGLAEYKGKWIPKEEKEKLEHEDRGEILVDGAWVKKADIERAKHEAEMRVEALEHRTKGEFRVGDKWLPKADAEMFYKDVTHPYVAEGDHVKLYTNNGIDFGDKMMVTAEAAYRKANEFFGKEPALKGKKLNIYVVATLDEYKQLGATWGDDKSSNVSMFCSGWNPQQAPPEIDMVSVTMYYQSQNNTELYATHATVEQYIKRLIGPDAAETPSPWFVDGVSSYIERWQSPKLFDWSRQRLRAVGWVGKLKTLFKTYTPTETNILSAGLVVSFLKSPDCPAPVTKAFTDCIKAINEGGKMQKAFKDLEKALIDKPNEDAFVDFSVK